MQSASVFARAHLVLRLIKQIQWNSNELIGESYVSIIPREPCMSYTNLLEISNESQRYLLSYLDIYIFFKLFFKMFLSGSFLVSSCNSPVSNVKGFLRPTLYLTFQLRLGIISSLANHDHKMHNISELYFSQQS